MIKVLVDVRKTSTLAFGGVPGRFMIELDYVRQKTVRNSDLPMLAVSITNQRHASDRLPGVCVRVLPDATLQICIAVLVRSRTPTARRCCRDSVDAPRGTP